MAGKSCVIGGGEHTSGLRILGVHGWMDNANSFDTLAPYLPRGTELLAVDLPGHGHSAHLPAGAQYDLLTYLINLRRAVDKAGWERFVILGHSLGGGLGTIFAALFPERVMAVISLDCIILKFWSVENFQTKISLLLKTEELKKQDPLVYTEQQTIQKLMHTRHSSIDEDVAYIFLPRSASQVEGGYVWNHDQRVKAGFHTMFSTETWFKIVASVKCPVLIIPANQGVWNPKTREAAKKLIACYRSHARWFEMTAVDGSHDVHLTHPERVAKTLLPFLQRVTMEVPVSKPLLARL